MLTLMKIALIINRFYYSLLWLGALQVVDSPSLLRAAEPAEELNPPPWARHYTEGEKIIYKMKVSNRGRTTTRVSAIEADGVVKKDAAGILFEEFTWNHMTMDEKEIAFSPDTQNFRQQMSLPLVAQPADFMKIFSVIHALGKLDSFMVGPVADLSTFYVDMLFCSQFGGQAKAGDHRLISMGGAPNSWADGTMIVLGEDSVDFDCNVEEIDRDHQTATLLIKHLPPEKPLIKLPAEWMRAPVSDTANNWVEVIKNNNGTYTAAVGKETFEVKIKVSLTDGRILSAQMDNPVEVLERECTDAELTKAGPPVRYKIRRQIDLE